VTLSNGRLSGKRVFNCLVGLICGDNARFNVELHGVTLHEININGSGDVALGEIRQDRLALTIRGSGDVSGSGQVDDLSVSITGSGDGHLEKLTAKRLAVELEGSGDVAAGVTDRADISIAGSGDVHLAGAMPGEITTHISGSGTVTDSQGRRITRRSDSDHQRMR
jgi:hypothetical protein